MVPGRHAASWRQGTLAVGLLLLTAAWGCGGSSKGQGPAPAPAPTPGQPVITTFTATPPSVVLGGSSNLAWTCTGTTSLTLTPGNTNENPTSGNQMVAPTATTAYTLTAVSGTQTTKVVVTVTVQCQVTFSPGAGGSLQGTATQTVALGGSCTAVTAVPASGYAFVNWTGQGFTTSTQNPLTVSGVGSNLALTANFAATGPPSPLTWSSRGTGAGGAFYVPSISPFNANDFWVSSDMSGVYHTTTFGTSYTLQDFAQITGAQFSAVGFTSSASVLFGLTYGNGNNAVLTKSLDGGATWSTAAIHDPVPGNSKYGLWSDAAAPGRVVTCDYNSIYLSTDGGATFTTAYAWPPSGTANDGNGLNLGGVCFDGTAIYFGTNRGLLVSTDSGTTFTNAGNPGLAAGEAIVSFTGARSGGTLRFFALTFPLNQSYPEAAPGGNYELWSASVATNNGFYPMMMGLYAMDNATGPWTARSGGISRANDALQLLAMAQGDIQTVYAAGSDLTTNAPKVMKTVDGGQTWTNSFLAQNNANVLTGWSGTGGDRDWTYGQVAYGLAVAPTDASHVVITDMGFVHGTTDGGATWRQAYVNPADQHPVGAVVIAKQKYHSIALENTSCYQLLWSDASNLFTAFTDIHGLRSDDGGVTWSFNYSGLAANTTYRLVRDATSGRLYAGTSDIHDLYQSTRLANAQLDANDGHGDLLVSPD